MKTAERFFDLAANATTVRTELLAGVTTFLTMAYISPSLKNGIAAGIGLFIAFIGLQNAGFIVGSPGTLVMIGIPLCYSISDGLALGFIAYLVIKTFAGRRREVPVAMYVIAVALMAYFVLRTRI
jgi:AGZA family xanthine/uracil permease-like MFS transporter